MKILAPYLLNLLEYAGYQNIDKEWLRSRMSKQKMDLSDPAEVIDVEEYLAILDKIIEGTNNNYTGLRFGAYLNLSSLGLVLEISLSTSSFEHGIIILKNYLDTNFPLVSARLIEDSENYTLQLDCFIEDQRLKNNLLDMVLCIVYREMKLMLPAEFKPLVRLPYVDAKPYKDVFKEGVAYNSNYQIVLPSEVVKVEINKNRIREIELLLPKFISMLKDSKESDKDFSSQIRSMTLSMCSPEIPNFEQVQKQFFYSKRTIQRKLTKEGMSFRKIVSNIKRELSHYLSYEKHLKTKDIAYILGYSESSAYLHALKEWKNES